MKIVVLGGTGQVGGELKRLYPQAEYPGRGEIDLGKKESIDDYFLKHRPDVIINCAAYTQVDKAESESESEVCYLINTRAIEWIAPHCERIVHFSTDYVFNGKGYRPYLETDALDPLNIYGKSKAEGEELLLRLCPNAVVIRTSWVYSDLGKNFVKTMCQLSEQREELRVVSDQVGSPTYAADLAQVVVEHAIKRWSFRPGIYHYSNEGVASWYDLATEIMRIKSSACRVIPITTEDYPTPAKRPFYSVLSKEKIKSELKVAIPHWKTSLERCMQKFS